MRKLLRWTQVQIDAIEADERYHGERAAVQINAPLALVQTVMVAQMDILTFLREEIRERLINEWHEGGGGSDLSEWLEMSEAEYAAWVEGRQ